MTLEEILIVLKEATDTFGDIDVKPTENEMSCMNRNLLPILLKIPYNQVDATHNFSGLVKPSTKYTTKYGTAFKRPTGPVPYYSTITVTMSDVN